MEFFAVGLVLVITFALFSYFYIWLPAEMAEERGRSVGGWVLLTFLCSPIFTIVALLVLGPTVEMDVESALEREREKQGGKASGGAP